MNGPHAHPCDFRLHRTFDRGWGELACEYRWSSDAGTKASTGAMPELDRCYLFEVTTYECETGGTVHGWLMPPDPPFVGWRFRNPTDGRTGPVGLERFSAAEGSAWDRHKLPGPLTAPEQPGAWTIAATQQYWFHCEVCGVSSPVAGPNAGPHIVQRDFRRVEGASGRATWRYQVSKHDRAAWIDLDSLGYVADSAAIGFGPAWLYQRT